MFLSSLTPRWRLALEATGIFALTALALGWVVFPLEGFLGPDTYYHFRLAERMAAEGPFIGVTSLPLTILGTSGPDHHLLWHVLLMPFTMASDAFSGMQWAAVITGALVPTGLFIFMRSVRIPWAWLFAFLAVVAVSLMPGRLVMLRAQNIAVLLIAASLWAIMKRRPRTLGVIAFLFMGTYHGAVILAPMTLIYAGVVGLKERRFAWRPATFALAGGLLGLIINPFFPASFEYLFFHTIYTVPEAGLATGGGTEWSAPSLTTILQDGWAAHAALLLSLGAAAWRRKGAELTTETLFALAFAGFTLWMYANALRFAEYYSPFGVAAAGLVCRDVLGAAVPRRTLKIGVVAVLIGAIVAQAVVGFGVIRRHSEFLPQKYAELTAAIDQDRPGELVFNTAYHDFPFLYFHRPDLTYVIGLDPHYLSYTHEGLSKNWAWIGGVKAEEPNDPAPLIRKAFQSRWVVVDRHKRGLYARLVRSPHASLVKETRWGALFKIVLPEERSEPIEAP